MSEREPAVIVTALVMAVLLGLCVWALARFARRDPVDVPDSDERERRERDAREKRMLAEKTHVRIGEYLMLRCFVSGCDRPATRGRLAYLNDEGFVDFIRRQFGAPERLRIVELPLKTRFYWSKLRFRIGEPEHCEMHHHSGMEVLRMRLAEEDRKHRERTRDSQVALGRVERTLNSHLSEIVEKHEREQIGRRRQRKSDAKVLPLRTGTDPK